jgi:hypothetical protein
MNETCKNIWGGIVMRTLIASVVFCLVSTMALAAGPDLIWAGGGLKLSNNSNPCYFADSFISLGQVDSMYLFSEPMITDRGSKLGVDLGIGARLPLLNGRIIGGYNLFFDYTSNEGHKRIGTGIEIYHPLFSTHMNLYLPISNERGGEEALPGLDLTFGIPIPDAPFISVWPGYFFYSGRDESDLKGLSLAIQVNPIKPLFISFGGRSDTPQSGRDTSEMFIRMDVRIPLNRLGKDLFAFNPGEYPLSVRSQMDHKVVREEFITFENKSQ